MSEFANIKRIMTGQKAKPLNEAAFPPRGSSTFTDLERRADAHIREVTVAIQAYFKAVENMVDEIGGSPMGEVTAASIAMEELGVRSSEAETTFEMEMWREAQAALQRSRAHDRRLGGE